MIPIGCLELRRSEPGHRFNGPELYQGDIDLLRRLFPNFSLWQTVAADEICLRPTLEQAHELLQLVKMRLETQKPNTLSYLRSTMGGNRISEFVLLNGLAHFLEACQSRRCRFLTSHYWMK